MKKKLLIVLSIFLSIFFFTACGKKEETDAMKFKDEYESVNGTKTSSGKDIRNLEIPLDNPFVYKEASDIVDLLEAKETFAVYFGYNTCPWCRSVIPTLIEVLDDLDINKIYYVDIHDIRDTLEVNSDGEVVTSKKGSDDYYKLLELLDGVLEKYSLTDSKGKEVDAKEKRIYAPNVVSVINGEPQKLDTGISEKQTDSYMELTDDIKKDMYDKLKCVLDCLATEPEKCGIGC